MMPLSSWIKVSQQIIGIAIDEPYVMHSLLAVAGCHYRYHLKSPQQRCASENFHSMHACSGLRHSLDMPDIAKIDAAITTSMFLGALSFADTIEDFEVPLRRRPVAFFWLSNQPCLGSLLTLFQSKNAVQSMWHSMFEGAAEDIMQSDDNKPGTDDVRSAFAAIFELKETSLSNQHHIMRALHRLCGLLPIDPTNDLALLQYLQFMEVVSSQFLGLLNALDTRALMLLSYWLGLLCAKDCWWSRLRARNDCWAICEHLERYGDKSLWSFMDFPAAACGYPYTSAAPAGRDLVDRLRLTHSQLGVSAKHCVQDNCFNVN